MMLKFQIRCSFSLKLSHKNKINNFLDIFRCCYKLESIIYSIKHTQTLFILHNKTTTNKTLEIDSLTRNQSIPIYLLFSIRIKYY